MQTSFKPYGDKLKLIHKHRAYTLKYQSNPRDIIKPHTYTSNLKKNISIEPIAIHRTGHIYTELQQILIEPHTHIYLAQISVQYINRTLGRSSAVKKWAWPSNGKLDHQVGTWVSTRPGTQVSSSNQTYFVEISMAICTDLLRLSLMCKSTGSMLWMSMFVTTYKKKWTFYELTMTRSDDHGWLSTDETTQSQCHRSESLSS